MNDAQQLNDAQQSGDGVITSPGVAPPTHVVSLVGGVSAAQAVAAGNQLAAAVATGVQTIHLGPGTYRVSDTLLVKPGMNIIGAGRERVLIEYDGPTDGRAAVHIGQGVWNQNLGGFHLRRVGGTRQGKGIWACKHNYSGHYIGTVCGSNRYEDIGLDNFEYGLYLGHAGYTATSENRFVRVSTYNCRVGGFLTDYNTLNNHFVDLNISGGEFGLQCSQGGGETHVYGGSASTVGSPGVDHYQKSVFAFVSGGNYSVNNYRNGEGGTATFLKCATNATVLVDSCTVAGIHPLENRYIEAYYDSILTIRNCTMTGHVLTGYLRGAVRVEQCQITEAGRSRAVDVRFPTGNYTIVERGNNNNSGGSNVPMVNYVETGATAPYTYRNAAGVVLWGVTAAGRLVTNAGDAAPNNTAAPVLWVNEVVNGVTYKRPLYQ